MGFGCYGSGRVRTLLDRGFLSAANTAWILASDAGFHIPVPSNVKWFQDLIDNHRDQVESPEHMIFTSDDGHEALYGMTVLDKMDGKRVWKHLCYGLARRCENIAALFTNLKAWEEKLATGQTRNANQWAYEQYFTITTTPKRGRRVRRNQDAVNAYKSDRAILAAFTIQTNNQT